MPDDDQATRTLAGRGSPPPTASHSSASSSSVEEGRFPAGTVLAGRYRIQGLLGQGGMGEVYKAHDLILNQAVALKFLAEAAHANAAALERFRNEVRIARQVSHPNVCRVYDIGVMEGLHFLSMEYVDGEDLASLLRRIGRLPPDKALEFTRRICGGLAAAHERGVLHRDLKPANIMIDGRGQVRITDFGLAVLAGEVRQGDIRSGTPAYMSPEQKSGKEVTARSDLYSLGLVLHEMFTGKRRADTQTSMSELVKELDPAIESVILRCLDENPSGRPTSALHVAMALPGGDPVAAALAAGETPSPEMVAASGEKEGLPPRTAVLFFIAVLASLAGLAVLAQYATLQGQAPLPLPPDALAFRAGEMLKQFGYTERQADSVYGFADSPDRAAYLRYLRRSKAPNRSELLATHQPALTRFFYREATEDLWSTGLLSGALGGVLDSGVVTPSNPPNTQQGMVRISLDPTGRLIELEARPTVTEGPGEVAWPWLLTAAGLDASRFESTAPEAFLPVYADARMAWNGTYAEGRTEQLHVEAAALRGRPVFFSISGPWVEPPGAASARGIRRSNGAFIILGIVFVAILVAAGLVAWRNWRMGRGDRRGAGRLSAFVFGAAVVSWVLVATHVPGPAEINLLLQGLGLAAFQGAAIGLLYLAVEPYVRRNWPDALISWARFVGGRFRDPLVASHILLGLAAGAAAPALTRTLSWALTRNLESPAVAGLNGLRFTYGQLLGEFNVSAFITAGVVLVLVLLRLLVRKTKVADVLFGALIGVIGGMVSGSGLPVATLGGYFAALILIRRFGLLAAVVWGVVQGGLSASMAVESWYAVYSLTPLLLVAAVATWALYTILAMRREIRQ